MQRHVNDWPGTMKVATGFLKTLLNFKQSALDNKLLAEVIEESEDILKVYEAAKPKQPQTLVQELASVLNRRSLENGSNTPDFILADYLSRCLVLFDDATNARATWYGQPMKDLEFNKVGGVNVTPEENKAAQLRALHKTPYGANLGINSPEIVPGLKFANLHMPGHSFYVLSVNTEKNSIGVQIDRPASAGGHGWTEDWNLEHTRVGFDRGEYWELTEAPGAKLEADALKKRQFPAGGVVDGMKKAMARGIMEDIEKKTAETLQGYKQSIGYMQGPLWEEFKQTNAELAKMWDDGQRTTQEYKDLQKKANELAAEIGKVKKEAIEKEGADKMARMVADVMRVADGFVKAAKAIQVFNKEAKEADAIRKKFEHMEPKTGKNPIVDKKGFLFIAGNGDILWALHDGQKYCFCNWEGSEWVGWRVSEADVIEAGHTQLPLFLDSFVRQIMPTK
jgi:hypothetical protein